MSVYQILYVYPKVPITQAGVDARLSALRFCRYSEVTESHVPIPDPAGMYMASPDWVNDHYEGKPGYCYWPTVLVDGEHASLFIRSFNYGQIPGSVLDLIAFDYEGEICWWGSDTGGAYTDYDNTPVISRDRETNVYNHPPGDGLEGA